MIVILTPVPLFFTFKVIAEEYLFFSRYAVDRPFCFSNNQWELSYCWYSSNVSYMQKCSTTSFNITSNVKLYII